jgi:hypothetical protein
MYVNVGFTLKKLRFGYLAGVLVLFKVLTLFILLYAPKGDAKKTWGHPKPRSRNQGFVLLCVPFRIVKSRTPYTRSLRSFRYRA